ncbi:hypothetical protein [Mesorhizobium sp. B2-5-11]|uniref:hypothetical protein n=1 Tax=Mesorhizobium sp. B2-5-11 TaxID=2589919 RepID=UPI00112A8146|nr:hypothetical protein [Mesorhizobium sp. B2-5-11]TPK14118.1 hypothetical protein FJ490_02005 [Mesorhizobium sp. B2-5-11]
MSKVSSPPAAKGVTEAQINAAADEMAKHLEIDWDGDDPFVRSDSIDAALRAALASLSPLPEEGEAETERMKTYAGVVEGRLADALAEVLGVIQYPSFAAASFNELLEIVRERLSTPAAGELAVKDGWVLVPKEPTREMWAAMADTLYGYKNRHHDKVVSDLWEAMLAASPQQGEKA